MRGPRERPQAGCDRGSGTVLALVVAGALLAAIVMVATTTGALRERAAAQAAADAGALAGAMHARAAMARGDPAGDARGACALAARAVSRHGRVLTECATGPGVRVQVWVSDGATSVVARAGAGDP